PHGPADGGAGKGTRVEAAYPERCEKSPSRGRAGGQRRPGASDDQALMTLALNSATTSSNTKGSRRAGADRDRRLWRRPAYAARRYLAGEGSHQGDRRQDVLDLVQGLRQH